MSHQAVGWAYEQNVQPSGAKFVLVTLANYANSDGYCYPSQETLAKDTGQSVRAVRDHITKLEDAGILCRERRHAKSGQRRSDGFWLVGFKPLPADVAANQPAYSAAGQPAKVAASETSLPADSAADYRQISPSLPADSAGLYMEEPSVEPPIEPIHTAFDFVAAFLEEMKTDRANVADEWVDEQCKHGAWCLKQGYSVDQVCRCTRFLKSQTWRDSPISLKTVRAVIGDWVANGEPADGRRKTDATSRNNRQSGPYSDSAAEQPTTSQFRPRQPRNAAV